MKISVRNLFVTESLPHRQMSEIRTGKIGVFGQSNIQKRTLNQIKKALPRTLEKEGGLSLIAV